MKLREIIGTKYQTYENNKPVIYRIVDSKNNGSIDSYVYTLEDINDKSRSIKFADNIDIPDGYMVINPDAVMNIMTTKKGEDYDVYVCIHKTSDMTEGNNEPALILRQDIYSSSKNMLYNNSNIFMSELITKDTVQGEMKSILEFDRICSTLSIALYIDDTMNEIKYLLKNKIKKIDKVLKAIKDAKSSSNIYGYEDNLIDLMNNNNFIQYYKTIFGIVVLDFPIDIGNNVLDDGVVTINKKQHKKLEDRLQQYITDVVVLKYGKDIDVSKLIRHTHIFVCDSMGGLYFIAYKIVSDYPIPDNVQTNDIMQAMQGLGIG